LEFTFIKNAIISYSFQILRIVFELAEQRLLEAAYSFKADFVEFWNSEYFSRDKT
jgi:hypothetical protein